VSKKSKGTHSRGFAVASPWGGGSAEHQKIEQQWEKKSPANEKKELRKKSRVQGEKPT